MKTYDARQVVIPNADLFTRSVIVNTAFGSRRWEYDLNLKDVQDLDAIKSRIIEAVTSMPGVLQDPAPEALVLSVDIASPANATIRVLWWTNDPRQHQMLSSYDKVLTAIARALSRDRAAENTRTAAEGLNPKSRINPELVGTNKNARR